MGGLRVDRQVEQLTAYRAISCRAEFTKMFFASPNEIDYGTDGEGIDRSYLQ